jgi:hypothetical protein
LSRCICESWGEAWVSVFHVGRGLQGRALPGVLCPKLEREHRWAPALSSGRSFFAVGTPLVLRFQGRIQSHRGVSRQKKTRRNARNETRETAHEEGGMLALHVFQKNLSEGAGGRLGGVGCRLTAVEVLKQTRHWDADGSKPVLRANARRHSPQRGRKGRWQRA